MLARLGATRRPSVTTQLVRHPSSIRTEMHDMRIN
jgi:hypothetical protein